jgi:anaerobic selenocysteine-containing dehydrogenase
MNRFLKLCGVVATALVIHLGTANDWSASQMLASGGDPVPCTVYEIFSDCNSKPGMSCNSQDRDTSALENRDKVYTAYPTKDTQCNDDTNCRRTGMAYPKEGCMKVERKIGALE